MVYVVIYIYWCTTLPVVHVQWTYYQPCVRTRVRRHVVVVMGVLVIMVVVVVVVVVMVVVEVVVGIVVMVVVVKMVVMVTMIAVSTKWWSSVQCLLFLSCWLCVWIVCVLVSVVVLHACMHQAKPTYTSSGVCTTTTPTLMMMMIAWYCMY